MPSSTYYDELGVPTSASAAHVAAVFASWSAEHHPDLIRDHYVVVEERERMRREFDRRQDMVATLLDPVKRAVYDAAVARSAQREGACECESESDWHVV